ncbi:hypothetical protein STEG23_003911, partial [Scotinomys teguina]
ILTEPRSCLPLCSGNCGPCDVWIPSVLESDLVPVIAKGEGKDSLIPLCSPKSPHFRTLCIASESCGGDEPAKPVDRKLEEGKYTQRGREIFAAKFIVELAAWAVSLRGSLRLFFHLQARVTL